MDNIWIYCLWFSRTSTRRFVKGEKNEQKINHLPQKVGAKDERVDLAHFLHPESSPRHILPISCSSKVVEIRQNDFQKSSKVLKLVSHVFKSVPKSPICVQTFYNCPDKLDRGEGAIDYQDVGSGGHQTSRDKFSSDSCGHQRLEYSVRRVGVDQNSLQRGRMDNDLTTFFIRDQGGGAPNLFTPILGPFTVDGDTWCGCPVRVRGGGVKREDLSW